MVLLERGRKRAPWLLPPPQQVRNECSDRRHMSLFSGMADGGREGQPTPSHVRSARIGILQRASERATAQFTSSLFLCSFQVLTLSGHVCKTQSKAVYCHCGPYGRLSFSARLFPSSSSLVLSQSCVCHLHTVHKRVDSPLAGALLVVKIRRLDRIKPAAAT